MSYRPRLKICGVTSADDARLVAGSGADYCGILIDVTFSERSLSLRQAREVASASTIPVVILLCDPKLEAAQQVAEEIRPYAVQLLGRETPEFLGKLRALLPCRVWKVVHLPAVPGQASPEEYIAAGADALLVDTAESSEGFVRLGGTGKVADWKAAAKLVRTSSVPVFLAGGIHPENVAGALAEVRPDGIDLCSGVEASKGKKDPEKVRTLVHNFKAAEAKIAEGEQ